MTGEELTPGHVPGDADPWPRELPFTVYGQLGEDYLDLRVFDQDTYWVDLGGRPHLISEMTDEHIRHVIAFLLENVEYFYLAATVRMAAQVAGDMLLGRPSGELLAMEAGGGALRDLEPVEWLEATPIWRALLAGQTSP